MALQARPGSFMASMGDGGFCQGYYGLWQDIGDCVKATGKLEENSERIDYATKGSGRHVLPLYVQSGRSTAGRPPRSY